MVIISNHHSLCLIIFQIWFFWKNLWFFVDVVFALLLSVVVPCWFGLCSLHWYHKPKSSQSNLFMSDELDHPHGNSDGGAQIKCILLLVSYYAQEKKICSLLYFWSIFLFMPFTWCLCVSSSWNLKEGRKSLQHESGRYIFSLEEIAK